jgi:hypothetical protein
MPRTSTTRPRGRGGPAKGAGWGGSAKGASTSRLTAAGDPYSDHIRALAVDPAHAAAKAPLRELAMRTWVEVCQDAEHPQRVVAAEKLFDRLDGRARQAVETSGPGGGPVETKVTVRIVRPDDGGPSGV